MILESMAKKIRLSSEEVEKYSAERVRRYGVDGVLPAEFFPAYQWLRQGDWTREFLVFGGDVVLAYKKIRIFSAQYNRLEGLPLSLSGDVEKERQALDIVLKCGWLHKARVCQQEVELLQTRFGLSAVQEAAVANFWYDTSKRYERTLKSSWRPRSVLNWAKTAGSLEWRSPTYKDQDGIARLYDSWKEKKQLEKQTVMFKELYGSLTARHFPGSDKLDVSILAWNDQAVAFVVHLISDNSAHLLANISVSNTTFDFGCPPKLKPYVGQIVTHFSSKSFSKRGIQTGFLGYCEENDPLIKYKRSLADGETKLFLVDICKPTEKKKQETPRGLI